MRIENQGKGIKLLDIAMKLLSLISLAIGAIAAYFALPLDRQVKQLQTEMIRIDNALKLTDADLKKLKNQKLCWKMGEAWVLSDDRSGWAGSGQLAHLQVVW